MSKFKQIYHSSFFHLLQIKTSYQKDNALIYLRTKDVRDILVEIYLRGRWAKRLEQKITHLGKRWVRVISMVVCESWVRAPSPPSSGSKQLLRLLEGLRDSTSPGFVKSRELFQISGFQCQMESALSVPLRDTAVYILPDSLVLGHRVCLWPPCL